MPNEIDSSCTPPPEKMPIASPAGSSVKLTWLGVAPLSLSASSCSQRLLPLFAVRRGR